MTDPFRTPPDPDPPKQALPRWPILLGLWRVTRTVFWALGWSVRYSPIWVPCFLAYLLTPVSLILFGLRYAGGAYDRPDLRVSRYGSCPPDLDDPVGPVDLPARVFRRWTSQPWMGETEDAAFGISLTLWLYTLGWTFAGIVLIVKACD